MQRFIPIVVATLVACGSEAPPPGPGGEPGVPRTGSQASEPVGPRGLDVHREALVALVKESGTTVDLAAIEREPIMVAEVELDEATRTFTAKVDVSFVNAGPQPIELLDFVLPANVDATRVRIDGVTLDGVARATPQSQSQWSVPVALGPGARVTVGYRLSGSLAGARTESEPAMADPLAALQLTTFVPRASALAAFGERDGVVVLSGFVPRVVGQPRATLATTVLAASDATAYATGTETRRERRGALSATRFVAPSVSDAAVVVTRGLAQSRSEAGPAAVITAHPNGASVELVTTAARRALEDGQSTLGPGPSELRVIACPALAGQGIAELPGFVLVPPESFTAEAPELTDDPLGALMGRHPAPREALQLAVAAAVHRQWWLGRGADALATLVLEDGVSVVAALDTIARADGDKAARRARVLGLELPYLDARGQSPLRPLERAATGAEPVLSRTPAQAGAGPKAGLFVAALARHLGATIHVEALRGLGWAVSSDALRAAWLARAPRRAETEALMTRWLDEAHADEDVEAPSLATLFEYLALDGIAGAGSRLLVDELTDRPDLVGKGLDALQNGFNPGMALELFDELTGEKDPELKRWLELAKGMLGADRGKAIDTLVDELAAEIGVPEAERARLRMMAEMALNALGQPGPTEPAPGSAPVPEIRLDDPEP